ncbi:MAG TPA: PTS sugar transporter subunit IIA [Burkholderiaceae bacterium]|jgi:PTS system nitrogen regulatory IIA component
MNQIAKLCPAEDILLARDIRNKGQLFDVVARHFEQRHGLSVKDVDDSLNAREALGSTGVGNGVAIPHARMAGLQHVVAAFVRPKVAIAFDAPDRKPVSDVLVLLVPEEALQEHLQILADIAHLFSDRRFRDQLQACAGPDEVSRIFRDWPSKG